MIARLDVERREEMEGREEGRDERKRIDNGVLDTNIRLRREILPLSSHSHNDFISGLVGIADTQVHE